MKLLEHITSRPVAVSMIYLVILTTGLVSFFHLPLELMPGVDMPQLSVQTFWPHASPETIEAFVTSPIEGVCNTLNGAHKVTSTSQEGSSQISIEFNRQTNMDFAALELNEKLSLVRKNLPYGAQQPRIIKYIPKEFDAGAFITVHVSGDMPLSDLRYYALDKIRGPLMSIDGIASAEVIGGVDPVVEIECNSEKMQNLGISTAHIFTALQEATANDGLAILQQQDMRYSLRLGHQLKTLYDIENVSIHPQQAQPIRLCDVAAVRMTHSIPHHLKRIDGQPAVVVELHKEPGANSIRTANAVFAKIEKLKSAFPPGMHIFTVNDQSEQIRKELKDITSRAGFSLLIVFLILLFFLRQLSSPVIILSTIFFAVLICINLFYVCHMSLNMLTLAGLALGFGMLVDNSVVVLDNIFRFHATGISSQQASIQGTREVIIPVLASTLTTMAALGPFLYMSGDTRIFYIPFAQAVVFSLAASVLVAFTFTPALTSRLLDRFPKKQIEKPAPYIAGYRKMLHFCLHHKIIILIAVLILLAGSSWTFFKYVYRGEVWRSNYHETLRVNISFPAGTELAHVDSTAHRFEQEALRDNRTDMVTCDIYGENAGLHISFTPEVEYSIYPYILKEKLIAAAANIGGARIGVYGFGDGFSSGGGSSSSSFSIKVLGYNYKMVKAYAESIGDRLKRYARVKDINTNAVNRWSNDDSWEMALTPQRQKMQQNHISVMQALAQVQPHLRENTALQTLMLNNRQEQLQIKTQDAAAFDIQALHDLKVINSQGNPVKITDIMEITRQPVLTRIDRENQQYQRLISFTFHGPYKMGNKLRDNIIETTHLPPGFSVTKNDSYWSMDDEENKQIRWVITLSLLFVFMITAALFESLRRPFVVMLTVPLGLIGVFLIYWLTGRNFDRGAYIGLVLLGGIVVNNAILLVSHIHHLQNSGLPLHQAIIDGAGHRIRPILMTSLTTILGLLPLVIQSDATTVWSSLALTTMGGLAGSTLLVLFVLPVLYMLIVRKTQ